MTLTANNRHYVEWTAYLEHQQPRTLIVWRRNDPLMLLVAAEFVKQVVQAVDLQVHEALSSCHAIKIWDGVIRASTAGKECNAARAKHVDRRRLRVCRH